MEGGGRLWKGWTVEEWVDGCGRGGRLWKGWTVVERVDGCGRGGRLWKGWTVVEGVDGCGRGGRLWKGVDGCGRGERLWKGVDGCGRLWKGWTVVEGVDGCGRGGRLWKGVDGCGRWYEEVWVDSYILKIRMGLNDRFVTDEEKVFLSNMTSTNLIEVTEDISLEVDDIILNKEVEKLWNLQTLGEFRAMNYPGMRSVRVALSS